MALTSTSSLYAAHHTQTAHFDTLAQRIKCTPKAQRVECTPKARCIERTPKAQRIEHTPKAQCIKRTPKVQRVECMPKAPTSSQSIHAHRKSNPAQDTLLAKSSQFPAVKTHATHQAGFKTPSTIVCHPSHRLAPTAHRLTPYPTDSYLSIEFNLE